MLNFRGGIKPDSHKYTKNVDVANALLPEYVKLQVYGDDVCVNVGDDVVIGQPLTINHRSHASVCGTVTEIDEKFITVKSSDNTECFESNIPFNKKLSKATYEDIYSFACTKGICYDGKFLSDKLENSIGKAKILIVSCGETAPFSCSKYKTLSLNKKEIIYGAKILMKALGIPKAAVTLEAVYFKDVSELKKIIGKPANIEVVTHTSKYPAEHPNILKKEFIRKYVSKSDDICEDSILIVSCEEAAALFTSFKSGMPMINKLVTIDGDAVYNPQTLLVPIGTPILHLLDLCETDTEEIGALVSGNPICGEPIDINGVVSKETSTILALGNKFSISTPVECISCGLCHKVCPVGLYPDLLKKGRVKHKNCIGCNSCTYICPSKIDFSLICEETEVENEN